MVVVVMMMMMMMMMMMVMMMMVYAHFISIWIEKTVSEKVCRR